MALLFVDSFDHYTTDAQILTKWNAGTNASQYRINASGGRNGTQSWEVEGVASAGSISKTFTGAATIVTGFAFQLPSLPASTKVLCGFWNSGTKHVDIRISAAGAIIATRNGTTLGTSANVVTTSYHYIEIKVTINDTTGVVDIYLDGASVLSLSSQDTRNGASAIIDTFMLSDSGLGNTMLMNVDDVYILNTSGGSPLNDFLGDVRVECLFPSGAGNYTQWTASAGSNYQCVDEATPNDDTDYISSSTAGHIDTYAYGNLTSTGGTVYAVAVNMYARKDDAGTRTIKSKARLSSTDAAGADQNVTTSYTVYQQLHTAKPGGGTWSVSDVNSAEFGAEVVA